jgi:short-subunit dehydrogenase
VVITGAASGIGKELASLFAAAGADTALLDVNGDLLEKSAAELAEAHGRKVWSRRADVTDYEAFRKAVEEVIADLGPIDVFVNNAGIGVTGEFVNNTVEDIDSITRVNYLGMVYGSHIILQHFYQQGYGHLVNVASGAGLQGFPRMSLYCGTKAGVVNFSQSIRYELKRRGIDLSLVLPSSTDTPMIMDELDAPDEKIPGILMAIPLCKTQDVARAAFNGIKKKKFIIFPTLPDRLALYARNFTPFITNLLISMVGFNSFKKKRERLIKEYDLD